MTTAVNSGERSNPMNPMNGGDPEDEQAASDRIRAALKRV
jgi:hypothetical protein